MTVLNKKCPKCKVTKTCEDFHKHKNRKGGLHVYCKECKKQRDVDNIDKLRVQRKKFYKKNIEKIKQYRRSYAKKYRCKIKELRAAYYKKNIEKLRLVKKLRYYKYRDINRKKSRERYEANKKKLLAQKKKYYQLNKQLFFARNALRRATRMRATPHWLSSHQKLLINDFFVAAQELKPLAGCSLHVDHIIPLKGKEVCGLHVPWNLQLLTEEENIKKGNRYEDDK